MIDGKVLLPLMDSISEYNQSCRAYLSDFTDPSKFYMAQEKQRKVRWYLHVAYAIIAHHVSYAIAKSVGHTIVASVRG